MRTNVGSDGPSDVVFGSPRVVSSYGTLDGQALEFNTVGNRPSFYYDQIHFFIPPLSERFLRLSFDFYSQNTVDTPVKFVVIFDTPTINKLDLTEFGTIKLFSPFVPSPPGPIGNYEDGERYSLVVDVDLQQRLWTIFLDGTSLGTYNFLLDDKVRSIRLSYGVTRSQQTPPPSDVSMGVDNICISSSSSMFSVT